MVEGNLRLTFDRDDATFDIRKIENLTVKYRFVQPEIFDNTAEVSRIAEQSQPRPPTRLQVPIVNSTFSMPAGAWRWFNFSLPSYGRVSGTFVAHDNASVQGLVMTEAEFINWRNSNQNLAYYRSGNVTIGSVNVNLQPGRYVFVIYNPNVFSAKTVTASVFAQ